MKQDEKKRDHVSAGGGRMYFTIGTYTDKGGEPAALLSIGTIDTEKTADVEKEPIEEDEDREGADLFAMTQSSAEGQLDKGAEENGDKAEEADTSDDAGEQDESSVQEESGERNSALQEILGDAIGSSVILESTRTETEYAQAYEKAKNANWAIRIWASPTWTII